MDLHIDLTRTLSLFSRSPCHIDSMIGDPYMLSSLYFGTRIPQLQRM